MIELCCSRSRPTSVISSPICRFSAAKSDRAAVSVVVANVLPVRTCPSPGGVAVCDCAARPSAWNALRAIGSAVTVVAIGDVGTSCVGTRGMLINVGSSASEEVGKGGLEDHEGGGSAACSNGIGFISGSG